MDAVKLNDMINEFEESVNDLKSVSELYEKIDYLESELDIVLFEAKHQRNDIKRFLLLLIENDIPIPEDLISKYIDKIPVKPAIKLPF